MTQYLLWASIAAGVVAVAAGLAGFTAIAGGAAAILLVLFLLLPWVREEKARSYPFALTRQ